MASGGRPWPGVPRLLRQDKLPHRFYLARTGRNAFAPDAPRILADFRDHLPSLARERFARLAYVARFVVPGMDGRWSEAELVLFESAPPAAGSH
jgi:hypothetical protein